MKQENKINYKSIVDITEQEWEFMDNLLIKNFTKEGYELWMK